MLNKKHEVNENRFDTHGCQPSSSVCPGSKSPCVNEISHQMTAKPNHDSRKLSANTSSVQRHWASTSVVKISWRNLSLRLEILEWSMLQSPFLKTALRRIFLIAPGLKRLENETLGELCWEI